MRSLALIAAVASNGVMGRDGALPWRLPEDLKHFKATTLGHCLLLGRKTWDSLPGPLPGRTSIVITRNEGFEAQGARVVSSLEAALALAAELGDAEPVVAGGAEIYALSLPLATRIWFTRVHADVDGDVQFPSWEDSGWHCVESRDYAPDARHAYGFTIEHWCRDAVGA
jgi:dihydrofolate reductase